MASLPIAKQADLFMPLQPRSAFLVAAVCIWCCAIAIGFGLLLHYMHQRGDCGTPPKEWPSEIALNHSRDRHTLLLFAHPHCPCTRATFRELDRLVSQATDRVQVHIIFVGLDGVAGTAANTPLSSSVCQLGFGEIHYDDGLLGKRFQVQTSGHVLLYGVDGRLQFSGGITASRGHEGDSIGGGSIASLLAGRPTRVTSAPVYGCPIFSKRSKCSVQPCAVAVKRT